MVNLARILFKWFLSPLLGSIEQFESQVEENIAAQAIEVVMKEQVLSENILYTFLVEDPCEGVRSS